MSPRDGYQRGWLAVTGTTVAVLAVVAVLLTPTSRLPILAIAVAAAAIAGATWSTAAEGPEIEVPPGTQSRRAAVGALSIMTAVGAGHVGAHAVVAIVVLGLSCPWLTRAVGRR